MGKNKKKPSKPVKLWTMDTETRGLFGDVFRVGLYDGENYYDGNTFSDVRPHLEKASSSFENHVYIHNLDFDIAKIAYDVLDEITFKDSIFINNNIAVLSTRSVTFHDSLKLLPSSLKKLSKDFGLGEASKINLSDHLKSNGYTDEGDYFEHVDPNEPMLNLYLQYDCTSLYLILMQVIEISGLDLDEFIYCPTAASLALKVFKENYPDDYKDSTSTNYRGEIGQATERFIREGYYGGRTEVFKPFLQNGFHYDVNSLYPYCMKAYEYPVGYYKQYTGMRAENLYTYWKTYKKGAGFAHVNIFVPLDLHIPPLPVRQNNKLIFPVGNLTGVWTFPELELAEKYGCVIDEITEVIYFQKTYPVFREFVLEFEEIKKNSEGAKREFSKLMQNSLYGKYGMRRLRCTLLDLEEKDEVEKKGERYTICYHPGLKKDFIQVQREANAQYIQPHIAAYVTSYARCLLYEGLRNPFNGDVAYCDTDSIACQNEFDSNMVHDKDYGKWKLENKIREGIFIQPKLYYELTDKTDKETGKPKETLKAKGIPKTILKDFTKETYTDIIDRINSGYDKVEIFKDKKVRRKFATMLKAGVEDFDSYQMIKKGLNLRARQKRQMDYVNNTSRPHTVNEWGEAFEEEFQSAFFLQDTWDPIQEGVNQEGYIRIMTKGDFYYSEYLTIPDEKRRQYFRQKGMSLDVWCESVGLEVDDVLERLMR